MNTCAESQSAAEYLISTRKQRPLGSENYLWSKKKSLNTQNNKKHGGHINVKVARDSVNFTETKSLWCSSLAKDPRD